MKILPGLPASSAEGDTVGSSFVFGSDMKCYCLVNKWADLMGSLQSLFDFVLNIVKAAISGVVVENFLPHGDSVLNPAVLEK